MTTGFAVFLAAVVLGAVLAFIACRRTWLRHGRDMAVREAIVMALSLGAYTGICLWVGYTIGAQVLAAALSAIPLVLGARYVPSIRDYLGDGR